MSDKPIQSPLRAARKDAGNFQLSKKIGEFNHSRNNKKGTIMTPVQIFFRALAVGTLAAGWIGAFVYACGSTAEQAPMGWVVAAGGTVGAVILWKKGT